MSNKYTSRLSGFHKLSQSERLESLSQQLPPDSLDSEHFMNTGNVPFSLLDSMVENVIGTLNIPIGIATNMIIDGEERLIPMATEESSVVAAVCNAAKQCRNAGGFTTAVSGNVMIAQVQLTNISNPQAARLAILARKQEISGFCNASDPVLVKFGGGFRDVQVRLVDDGQEMLVIVHLHIDTRDAMGANAVNTMAEGLSPKLENWTKGKANLRILSNLADQRLARATATWQLADIGGEEVRDAMLSAYRFALADPYRAATHNKGIMNGVSAVVLATGNDTRAVEAGAHAYACQTGQYRSLSHWEVDADGNLCGSLEMPLAVGLVGGATKLHPTAKQNLAIMCLDSAETLARSTCAVGLAQNFAAMKALATTGIHNGHMALHAKNIAIMAGASGDDIGTVAQQMIEAGTVRVDVAEKLLSK